MIHIKWIMMHIISGLLQEKSNIIQVENDWFEFTVDRKWIKMNFLINGKRENNFWSNFLLVTWRICMPFRISIQMLEFRFWSTFKLFEISILVQFKQLTMDQNRNSKNKWSYDCWSEPRRNFKQLEFCGSKSKFEKFAKNRIGRPKRGPQCIWSN